MKGFFNKILRIDLSRQSYAYEPLSDDVLKKTLGGKGLGTWLLVNENPVGVHPLDPDNKFIVNTGPATGTKIWGQARFGVFSKSPATGGYFESYCGGRLPAKIKGCGVDAIVIDGKCDKLSFLAIDESGVVFESAEEIKGKDAFEAEDYILANSPEGSGAMAIGPAGENLIAFACIKSEHYRSLGRGGMGAILGSKNLKGMSFAGKLKCEIFDPDLLSEVSKAIARKGKDSTGTKFYRKYGTIWNVANTNAVKCFPTRYWSSGYFDKWETISAKYMHEHFEVKNHGCPTCFLQCTKHARVKSGRHEGLELEGPEFETTYSLGGLNAIEGLEEVAWLNVVCDRLGIDTMSAGNISAFAIEAYKRGKIDFEIDYNQPDRVAELFELIAHKKGVGKIFAKGIKEAARELGLEDIAIHVKGLEPAGFDPRVFKGMGLSYATAARGACHLRGTFYKPELSGEIAPDQIEDKARLLVDYEDRSAIYDCLILCRFFRDLILWPELKSIIKATTGLDFSQEEIEVFANNVTQQSREYNLREGIGVAEDTLPKRLLTEATAEGATITEEEIDTLVADYNNIRNSRKNVS